MNLGRLKFASMTMAASLALSWAAIATPASAQQTEQNPQMVVLGQRIWKEKIACNDCHGWSGNGVPDDSRQPVGANLRETKLTEEQLVEVIKCGRPATGMPHFDARAYEDDRCYGLKAADLGKDVPPFLGTGLIPREIQAVVAYLEAKVIGRGAFTRAECEDYFGQGATVCGSFTYGSNAPQALPADAARTQNRGNGSPH